jgi:hypothetical protein
MNVLQILYDSEINFELSTFWDAGFFWKLGSEENGFVAEGDTRTANEAIEQLTKAAVREYPLSDFAKQVSRARHHKDN